MTIYLQNLEWAENFDMNKINFSRSVFFKKMAQIRPEMLRTTVFATLDIIGSKSCRQICWTLNFLLWFSSKILNFMFMIENVASYRINRRYIRLNCEKRKITCLFPSRAHFYGYIFALIIIKLLIWLHFCKICFEVRSLNRKNKCCPSSFL